MSIRTMSVALGLAISLLLPAPAPAQGRWGWRYVAVTTGSNATETRSWVLEEFLGVSVANGEIVALYSVSENGDPMQSQTARWVGRDVGRSIRFRQIAACPFLAAHLSSPISNDFGRKTRTTSAGETIF